MRYIFGILFKWLIEYGDTEKAIRNNDIHGKIKSDDWKRKHGLIK